MTSHRTHPAPLLATDPPLVAAVYALVDGLNDALRRQALDDLEAPSIFDDPVLALRRPA